jgi:hypothetical protein
MANRDNPHGLAPLMRTLSGGCPSIRPYSRDADSATAIFINDVVSRDADGNINAGGTPNTTTFQGVALVYAPGSVAKTDILVMDSPKALYEAQDNADTDGLVAADMGLMCDLEFNAGNAYSLISGHEIDESAAADTTTDLDVKLLRILDVPDNAAGSHCRVEIIFNQHRLNPGLAGV